MKKMLFVIAVLAFSFAGFAEITSVPGKNRESQSSEASSKSIDAVPSAVASPQSTACAFSFASGAASSNSSLRFCVTANGNIVQFETPAGIQFISQANHGEGYGICDIVPNVAYSDFGGFGDSGNWGPATVLSHSTNAVKIARTTSDGLWTLTQTITKVGGTSPSAKMAMALTNNSSIMKTAVLIRYADVDAASIAVNNFSGTGNSAMAWNSMFTTEVPYGVVLQNLSTLRDFTGEGFARDTAAPPNPCLPLAHFALDLLTAKDGSLEMFYQVNVRPHTTVTLTAAYKNW